MYYSNGNYEAFPRPRKPKGVENKTACFVGSGLAALSNKTKVSETKVSGTNGTVVIVSYFTCSVYAIQLGARRVASASAGNRDGGA